MVNSYRLNVEVIRPGLFGDAPPGRDGSPTPRISGLQPDLSNPTVTFVKVGATVVAKVPFMEIEKLGLRVGASWTSRLAQTCQQAFDVMQAREQGERIARDERKCAAEVEAKLTKQGITAAVAKQAIDELKKAGIVSEAPLPPLEPETNGKGRKAAKARPDMVRAVEAAEEALKKLPAKLDRAGKMRKLVAALARKGFDEDTANDAAAKALKSARPAPARKRPAARASR
ncbi:MAG TPA: hypothetical protein VD971_08625 [Phycisphaerales bacterium]|nr:hypothetical protein [Phycisphaerales bacterium]